MRVSCTRKRERGMTLILVAMCIFVFIGIAALAVDVGVLYTARTSTQHAADAGALAGAYAFISPPAGGASATYIQNVAATVANQNNVLGTPAGITAADVTVDTVNQRVTVNVPRSAARGNAITLFFARIFGLTTSDIAATATAEASTSPTASRCIRPVFIPNTVFAKDSFPLACSEIMLDPVTHQLTPYGNSMVGSSFILKDNAGGGSFVPSQYAELDFGAGSNTYRCLWSQCMNDPTCAVNQSLIGTGVQCATSYPVKTGDSPGPTKQGVQNLIGSPSDQWQALGEYYDPSTGTISTDSRSLTVAPVWDNCTQQISPGTNGQTATVIGFVEIFVDGVDGSGNISAHLVKPLGCGTGGGNGTGPFATPIRLVQAPPAS